MCWLSSLEIFEIVGFMKGLIWKMGSGKMGDELRKLINCLELVDLPPLILNAILVCFWHLNFGKSLNFIIDSNSIQLSICQYWIWLYKKLLSGYNFYILNKFSITLKKNPQIVKLFHFHVSFSFSKCKYDNFNYKNYVVLL